MRIYLAFQASKAAAQQTRRSAVFAISTKYVFEDTERKVSIKLRLQGSS
jgi:hypothetical protein